MSKTIAALLLFFYCNTVVSHAQTADEKAVADRVEQLRKVMITPDAAVLEDIAADKLVYVHSSGTVRDKPGFINEFIKGQSVFTAIALSNQVITLSGNEAIVRHRFQADTKKDNMPPRIDIIILMVWQKQNGKWRLLARQAAKIPETN